MQPVGRTGAELVSEAPWIGQYARGELLTPVSINDYYANTPPMKMYSRFRTLCNVVKRLGMKEVFQVVAETQRSAGRSARVSVLDIGCGKGGDLLKWAAHRPRMYVGLDACERSIEEARERNAQHVMRGKSAIRTEFHVCDFTQESLPCGDCSMDICACHFSMQYACESKRKLDNLLREVSRCLRVGGVFSTLFPDGRVVSSEILSSSKPVLTIGHFRIRCFVHTVPKVSMCPTVPCGIPYVFSLGEHSGGCVEYIASPLYIIERAKAHGLELIAESGAVQTVDRAGAWEPPEEEESDRQDFRSLDMFVGLMFRKECAV